MNIKVSIHAPTRGATQFQKIQFLFYSFQSTHPRGVRQELARAVLAYKIVSIHAPTRGATCCGCPRFSNYQSFNPRTHAGCDAALYAAGHPGIVSIHAPTRGATKLDIGEAEVGEFQSTHPRGVRPPEWRTPRSYSLCFNPRTHAGCDWTRPDFVAAISVSIHAPTRGATLNPATCRAFNLVSIHAPTRGATGRFEVRIICPCFNPRTHAGCDLPLPGRLGLERRFNPRTHAGCDTTVTLSA
ncbi:MAG: hypothetical protein PWP35_2022 [Bacteroidales bacterium]|nr:hypothetical protein [Bacteroidales bacterium]